jgi:hypothetical protein
MLPHHLRDEQWQKAHSRKFSFLVDRQIAVFGVRGEGVQTKALFTKHQAMISLLVNNFYHNLIMHELEKDLGGMLAERYGTNFESIIEKYIRPFPGDFS